MAAPLPFVALAPFSAPAPAPVPVPVPVPTIISAPVATPLPVPAPVPVLAPVTVPISTIPTPSAAPSQPVSAKPSEKICQICREKRLEYTRYLNIFFSRRNNRAINPIEGRNYTLETLTYMSSPSLSKEINAQIQKYLPDKNRQYTLIECCSSIGGDTFGFLSNPNVSKVIAHEINPLRRQILQNNLQDYGFPSNKYEIRDEFTGVPPEYAGSIVYFDPPWIEEDPGAATLSDEFCTCNKQYTLQGIRVAGQTLEDWLKTLHDSAAMVIMKLPPGYKMKRPGNYNCHRKDYKGKSLIVTCVPKLVTRPTPAPAVGVAPKVGVAPQPAAGIPGLPTIAAPSVVPAAIPALELAVAPTIEPAVLPSFTKMDPPSQANFYEVSFRDWIGELQAQIYRVIAPMAIPETTPSADVHRKTLVNIDAMKIWIAAFTHKSYDPNPEDNYEMMEYIGDRVLKTVFAKYLYRKFPDIDEDIISKLDTIYMSKIRQNQIAQQMGLDGWIRSFFKLDVSVREDLFESMFGAILRIGDEVIGADSGTIIAYNLISKIFEGIEIDPKAVEADPKTRIKELLEKLSLITGGDLRPFGEPQRIQDGYRLIIRFSNYAQDVIRDIPEMMAMIQRANFNMGRDELAKETRKTKRSAEAAAYTAAIQKLAEIGFTREYADQKTQLMNERLLGQDWTNALQKARRDGYVDLEFFVNQKGTGNITYVQILGIQPDSKKKVLLTEGSGDIKVPDLKLKALQKYVRLT